MIKFAVICVSVFALLVFVDVDAMPGQGSGKVFGFFVTCFLLCVCFATIDCVLVVLYPFVRAMGCYFFTLKKYFL